MINFVQTYSGIELLIVSVAFLIAILFALTCHEYSHAFVAYMNGDLTSKSQGRLSLNPFKHIDPIGFISLLLFGFGWAKPVQVNDLKFKNYRRGIFLTSISGVVTNFLLAFVSVGLLVLCFPNFSASQFTSNLSNLELFFYYLISFGISINLSLFVFNLLPIPPLDGFNAITAFTRYDNKVINFLRRYSFIIFLIIIISPIFDIIFRLIYNLTIPTFIRFWMFIF